MNAGGMRPGRSEDRHAKPVVVVIVALALAAFVLLALLAAPPAAQGAAAKRVKAASRLQPFGSCASLVRYARRNARRTHGAPGVPTRAVPVAPQVVAPPPLGRADAQVPAASAPAAEGSVPSFSETNVQEAGVDEPDIVKTDGRRLVAITGGVLHAFDVTADVPRLVGSLKLEGVGHQLLVRGDRALVTASTGGAFPTPGPAGPGIGGAPEARPSTSPAGPGTQSALLTEVDLANPAAMAVRRTLTLDGALIDARLTGGTARVVVTSSPGPVPEPRIARAGLRTWVPSTVLRSRVSGRTFRRGVVPCDDVRHPPAFSGLDLLAVLTIDLDRGLFSVDRDAIMAGAQTVYASPRSLYVASRRYVAALESGRSIPSDVRTQIHRFDASVPDATSYRSSGDVPGFVLNQYALSEHEGALRVATTSEPAWLADGPRTESESAVTVLREQGSALAQVGRVGGLGRGERIYAVRFLGNKGYVVTFRQVDPLYTLDLANPSAPRVLGELKILGYSAYLHPVSENLLLGVGQDATEQGMREGAQLSLFDVSDLRRPVRVARAALGAGSSSAAEFDPHAFLFWKPTALTVLPLQTFGAPGTPGFNGAVGFRTASATLAEVGRVAHPAVGDAPAPGVARSVVAGGRLYTLSYGGLLASRLDTLEPIAFAGLTP